MIERVRPLKPSLSLLNALRKSYKQYNVEEKNLLFLTTLGATYKEGLVQHNLVKGKHASNHIKKQEETKIVNFGMIKDFVQLKVVIDIKQDVELNVVIDKEEVIYVKL